MKRYILFRLAALVAAVLTLGLGLGPAGAPARAADFADSAFLRLWTRDDAPVASSQAVRSWYWGPQPACSLREPYREAPDGSGQRLVQYFDKSRMELNNPAADPNAPWYVTNGLLTYELISGQVQVGNTSFQSRSPADIPLASDLDDANAPTYHSFQAVTSTPAGQHLAPSALGQQVTATIDRAGHVGNDPGKVYYPGTAIAYYEPLTHHNVPQVFWGFINQAGLVNEGGRLVQGPLSTPPMFVSGLPISEAYWARVKVAGQPTDVLIQAFERRVLTYIPAYARPWNVQMGNIGAHYRLWRYGSITCTPPPPPPPPPTATPVPPTATPGKPAPTATPLPLAILPFYRLLDPRTGEHFYTTDPAERSALLGQGWHAEGIEGLVWNQYQPHTTPFYRLYNNRQGTAARHLFTTSTVERDARLAEGWVLESGPMGIPGGGFVYRVGGGTNPLTVPLYRWYNGHLDDHIFTINPAPLNKLGYKGEGIAAYVIQP